MRIATMNHFEQTTTHKDNGCARLHTWQNPLSLKASCIGSLVNVTQKFQNTKAVNDLRAWLQHLSVVWKHHVSSFAMDLNGQQTPQELLQEICDKAGVRRQDVCSRGPRHPANHIRERTGPTCRMVTIIGNMCQGSHLRNRRKGTQRCSTTDWSSGSRRSSSWYSATSWRTQHKGWSACM